MSFHLMRPEWLLTLLPALLLAIPLWRRRAREGNWSTVIAPELLPHLVGKGTGGSRISPLPLVFLAWVLAAIAASGPSWEQIPQPIHQKQDAVVLLLDLSYSMKSNDLPPSRLDRARQKLLDLLEERREGQTGLIAYAGDAHIVAPLTDDTPTIANLLPALNPDIMPVPGSDPAAAVAQAVDLLHSAGIRQGKLLLVTDSLTERDSKAIEQVLAGSGAQLAIMGVGTSTGAPIPLPRGGFLKDQAGTIVMPALKERELRAVAAATNGRYRRMQFDNSDLQYLLEDRLLPDSTATQTLDRTTDAWHDQGFLIVLALLPFALALFRRGLLVCLLPLCFVATPQQAHAQLWDKLWLTADQRGQQALQAGDNESAAGLFENPDWAGTAAYRAGDFETAANQFSTQGDADSLYNRGNALARSNKLDEAIEAYRASLDRDPGRQDAEQNLALLEKLKEQQQEQQQQDQQEQQNQEQQDENEQEQQQGQSQGESNQDGNQEDQQSEQQNQQEGEQQQSQGQQEAGEPDQQDPQQQQQQQPQEAQPQQGEQEAGEQGQTDQATPEDLEREQAMEQWLRRIPDDPSGLLREKFRYESRQREQQGARSNNEIYW